MPLMPPVPEALRPERNPGWEELPPIQTTITYSKVFYREEVRNNRRVGVWLALTSKGSTSITVLDLETP